MTPDENLAQLAATFGTPAALLIYMWVQTRQQAQRPDPGESINDKLDAIREVLHGLDNRLSIVETILEEREPKARR